MAVQVWIGEKPEHPSERRVIVALANGLERLDGLYLILANFSVGGRAIDLVIIKHDAIFIIELKHCDGRIIGSVNGPWYVESRNGEQKRLNAGRKNPYNQVISYFHALTNFLNEHRREFLSEHKSNSVDFRTCKRVVVIAPVIQDDSEIELDWKVELRGLNELPSFLVTERSSEIELNDEEMLAIPKLLHCTLWKDANAVLQDIIPNLDDVGEAEPVETPPTPVIAPTVTVATEAVVAPETTQPALLPRARAALRTTAGRVAAVATVLAVFLFALLLLRPTQEVIPQADQPPLVNVSADQSEVPAVLPSASSSVSCIWSGYQLVGKRWDAQAQDWTSVGLDGAAVVANPDVVIALERVAYCSDSITLTWSVQNNSNEAVEFPLRSDNIRISDGLGNEYVIADDASEPSAVRVEPGEQAGGTVTVPRAVSRSASSLLVRLQDEPFGEASFVVALQ